MTISQKDKKDYLKSTFSESYNILDFDKVVGEVIINTMPDMYIIWKLQIFEEFRNGGYGTMFFNNFYKFVKFHKPIRLAVNINNQDALRFYTRLGFKKLDQVRDWYWLQKN